MIGSRLVACAVVLASAWGCSGTTSDDGGSGGGSGSPQGGTGGSSVGTGGSAWPDGGGGAPSGGAGSGGGPSGGAPGGGGVGATGGGGAGSGGVGATGGAGASGGAPGGGGVGATGGGGSGGGCSAETCNNKDDDCDGQIDDGVTQSCNTACGSGTQTCAAGSFGPCSAPQPKSCMNYSTCKTEQQCTCPTAPSETCNLKDDNCDNNCDDFANCRDGVHRSSKAGEHFYTTSLSEAACCGFTVEFQNFFYVYKAATSGLVAFHRCLLANGKHFYTQASNCEGAAGSTYEGVLGYVATSAACGSVPLYRMSHPTASHFYTTSLAEKTNAVSTYGYIDEGIAGYVWSGP